jgi:hypothetical protein
MAAGRACAGRGYAWRGGRRMILRSGDIAVRTTPAAGRGGRAVVTSEGIGGTGGFGNAVPLVVTSEGIGGTGGWGGPVPSGDGRGRVAAGPGSGRGAAGSGTMSSLGRRGPPQRPRRPRGQRPAGTLRRRAGGRAAASRRPAAPLRLPGDGMAGGSARPGPSRAACGLEVAGIHRVTAAAGPGSRPGCFHQAPASPAGTRHRERHGHQQPC